MTMPSERTRALIAASAFLNDLQSDQDAPQAIRERAMSILRHYPSESSITDEAKWQDEYDDCVHLEPWLLPVDYYDRKK